MSVPTQTAPRAVSTSVCKPEALIQLGFLMMSDIMLETCLNYWRKWNNKNSVTELHLVGDLLLVILDAILSSFNLSSSVYFPSVLQNKSATTVDNIFIDTSKFPNYVVSPLYTGLSDHDARLITLSNIDIKIQNPKLKIIRRIDTYAILHFWYKLSFEAWDSIFDSNDVNSVFNSFLIIYLRIFTLVFLEKSKH
jgi:hypothetical protein